MAANLDFIFPPQQFNTSPVSSIYLTKESGIHALPRSKSNQERYKTFDELFSTYLTKLPEGNVKTFVTNLFNKNMIYYGTSTGRNETVISRVCLTNDKLTAIWLDSGLLEIEFDTGETSNIDECIYAAYSGLTRSAVLINKDKIRGNKDLHKLISTYIYLIVLRALGHKVMMGDKQKLLVLMACIYAYYKFYLNEKHSMCVGIIKRDYKDLFSDYISEFLPLLENISKYNTTKDIPKMLIDLNVIHEDPNIMVMNLLKTMGSTGFYSLIGPLDQLISCIVLAKYPTELYKKGCLVSEKIHNSIESIIVDYMNDIKYAPTALLSS